MASSVTVIVQRFAACGIRLSCLPDDMGGVTCYRMTREQADASVASRDVAATSVTVCDNLGREIARADRGDGKLCWYVQ